MELKLYAIYDKKAEEYGNPFVHTNDWLAARKLNTDLRNPASEIVMHASDFDLYYMGIYDTKSGYITADAPPRFIDSITNIIKGG